MGTKISQLPQLTSPLLVEFVPVYDPNDPTNTKKVILSDIITSLVPKTTTVNSHTLSSNITITKSDIGLSNITNVDTTTTANISDATNKRFITDAELVVLSNTSGVNTGDQNLSGYASINNPTFTGVLATPSINLNGVTRTTWPSGSGSSMPGTAGQVILSDGSGNPIVGTHPLVVDPTTGAVTGYAGATFGGIGRFTFSNTDYTNTGGANSILLMDNPASSAGQNALVSKINGTIVGKWRSDSSGNLNWISVGGDHIFFTGGDYPAHWQARLFNNGNFCIGDNVADNGSGAKLQVNGGATFGGGISAGAEIVMANLGAPANYTAGAMYWDTSTSPGTLKCYDGTFWRTVTLT